MNMQWDWPLLQPEDQKIRTNKLEHVHWMLNTESLALRTTGWLAVKL
jgi:hypothetical protein